MKLSLLKTTMCIFTCFSILCILPAPSSFASGNMQEVLSHEIAELQERLQGISGNERFDYPDDKVFFQKNINQLTNALSIIIDDNERVDYDAKLAYVSFQIKKLTDVLHTISQNERIYPGEKVYVSDKFNKLAKVLGIVIDDNERIDYLHMLALEKKNLELIQVLGIIIDDNERIDYSHILSIEKKNQGLSQILGIVISETEKYLEGDDNLKVQELAQFLGFIIDDNERDMHNLVEELIEVFSWISDNERLDYPEKVSVQKKIQVLTQVLGIVIDDNERIDDE